MHRNNGLTKIGINNPAKDKNDPSKQIILLRASEGSLSLAERMNNAYLRTIFNDTYIQSGQ